MIEPNGEVVTTMENEIWKIITELQQGDITKNEAVAKLLLLYKK